jgi:hypothetical protein
MDLHPYDTERHDTTRHDTINKSNLIEISVMSHEVDY